MADPELANVEPIPLVIGDDWTFPFTYCDPDGIAIDLTGYEVGGDVAFDMTALAVVPELLDQTSDETRGKFVLRLSREQTARIPAHVIGTRLRVYFIDPAGEKNSFAPWPLHVDVR